MSSSFCQSRAAKTAAKAKELPVIVATAEQQQQRK
jgi:hypothetical protein